MYPLPFSAAEGCRSLGPEAFRPGEAGQQLERGEGIPDTRALWAPDCTRKFLARDANSVPKAIPFLHAVHLSPQGPWPLLGLSDYAWENPGPIQLSINREQPS